jgi:hypothetical protein
MFDKNAPDLFGFSTEVWKSQLDFDTGYVIEWLPAAPQEFRTLPGSHGAFLNGIQLSPDEKTVFVSVTSNNELRKLDRASGRRLATVKVERPDNIAWDQSGYLLVASLNGSIFENLACLRRPGETCGLAFSIVRVNPSNLSLETVFQHAGAPMGAATVAQQVGDSFYLGSFTGDRIVKTAFKSKPD